MLKSYDELVRDRARVAPPQAVAGAGLLKGLGIGLVVVVPFWAWVANLALGAV